MQARRTASDRAVAPPAKLVRARPDLGAFVRIDTAGIGEHRVHGVTAFLQIRHAKARVESAGKRENDISHVLLPSRATSVAITAFCTCRRFSASSIAIHAGEAITASRAFTFRPSGRP